MDVLCVGHAAWDISVFISGFPAENSKRETRTMIECGGGPAANAAYLLSRWSVDCALAAAVGDDSYGERFVLEHAQGGTDLTLLRRSAGTPTPLSIILVNEQNGSRTIVNRKPHGTGEPLRLFGEAGTTASIWPRPPRVLLFDGHELEASLDAARMFPEALTILDAGSLRPGTRHLAGRVDYLVCSERFACEFSGVPDLNTPERQTAAVRALYRCNRHPVVITCGGRGVLYGTDERVDHLTPPPVKVRDTTGAGDIFHGAFAYGILQQLDWPDLLWLATVAGALSVAERGARTSIPSLREVQESLHHAG